MTRYAHYLWLLFCSALPLACGGDDEKGGGGEGGEGTSSPPPEGGSPGEGCATDPTEPNDSFDEAFPMNDEDAGLACGAAALAADGAFADEDDLDAFRIYADTTGCTSVTPTVTVSSNVAFEFCTYVEDCDDGPAIAACPDRLVDAPEVAGLRGCCGPIGGSGRQDVPDVRSCGSASSLVYVTLGSAAACGAYDLEFEL